MLYIIWALFFGTVITILFSQETLGPGESRSFTCPSGCVGTIGPNSALVAGATLSVTTTRTPTLTPTSTPTVTPSPTAVSGHPNHWHPPTTHEHGDAPPSWVLSSTLQPTFDGPEAHVGHKGILHTPTANGVEAYCIVHIISTPPGRATQYHTYKCWMRDPTGAVSYYYGTINSGDPLTTRKPRNQGELPTPFVGVIDQATYNQMGPACEIWYTFPTTSGPHLVWFICPPVYLYDPTDTSDPNTWTLLPSGSLGLAREAGLLWYDTYQPEGLFSNGYTAPTLKNYAIDEGSGGPPLIRFHTARQYQCPQCVAPN